MTGFDVDKRRVERLRSGDSFVEDVNSEQLNAALTSGRYLVTDVDEACAGFDVAVITVPTPLRAGTPDLSFIEDAGRALAPHVRAGTCVILESTTYPGTTQELLAPILEAGSGLMAGRDFRLGYSPERIDPGNRVHTFVTTPKVVAGIDAASLEAVAAFYRTLVDRVVPVSDCKVAELTKLLENTFRHVNVALVNELAVFADDLNIDLWEAIDAASTKPFGYMRFTPGPGVGGHCLPVDPSFLSWRVRQSLRKSFRFVELANDVNDHMPDYSVRRVQMGLNRRGKAVMGARILVLGLGFKRNSSDARESPALVVVDQLIALGADVGVCDPLVLASGQWPVRFTPVTATTEEIERADVVVVLTEHDLFDYDLVAAKAAYVFDARHRVPAGPNVEYL